MARTIPGPLAELALPKGPAPSRDRAPSASAPPLAEATTERIPQPSNSTPASSATSGAALYQPVVAGYVTPPASFAPSTPSGPAPYQPLVSGYASPPPPSTALQPRSQGPRPATLRERPRANHESREPDEIQIHIGRIEVTAVAPAPAAPSQPRAIRQTPSLDNYLRRGNGRA